MVLKGNFIFFLLVVLTTRLCLSSNKLQFEKTVSNNNISKQISDAILFIGYNYFNTKKVVYIYLPQKNDNDQLTAITDKVLKEISGAWTVLTNDTYCCSEVNEWVFSYDKQITVHCIPDVYIIPVFKNKSFDYFQAQLDTMERIDTFNPRAIFILIFLTNDCDVLPQNNSLNMKIFNSMWKKNLYNSTLIVSSECNLDITFATAKPFSSENNCRRVNKSGIKYYNMHSGKRNITELFNSETKTFRGCLFWTGTIPLAPYVLGRLVPINNKTNLQNVVKIDSNTQLEFFDGIDLKILDLFSIKMNFTYQFHEVKTIGMEAWFSRLPNGSVIGMLQELVYHHIDFAMGGIAPSYVTYYQYEYSSCYKISTLSWFVPDPSTIPQWMIFFRAFPLEVWVLSGLVFVIVSLLYSIMDSYNNYKKYKQNHWFSLERIPFANLFSICLGFSSILNPKSSYLRVLFFVWALYGMHWYIAYTSILFTMLTDPPLGEDINTIQELRDSNLRVSVDPIYLELFGHVELGKKTKTVMSRTFACVPMATCVKQFIENRNASLLEKVESLEFLVNVHRSKVHKISNNIATFGTSFISTKGSPLSKEINRLINVIFQAGLTGKWETDVGQKYRDIKDIDIDINKDSVPLSTQDLKGAFFILILGLITSAVICVGEILFP